MYLPSPLTHEESTATELQNETTVAPFEGRRSQFRHHTPVAELPFSSPPGDTQALSQFVYPPRALADEVDDEAAEGIWGYLIPLDDKFGDPLVLKKRDPCSSPAGRQANRRNGASRSKRGKTQLETPASQDHTGGYLIGRHSECGMCLPMGMW